MAGSRRGAAAAVPAFYRLLITLLTLFAFPRSADGGVHAVLPSSGAAGGSDTAVTVLGADFFQTPKTSCRFGGDVVAADVTDESTVVCYPPASVDGAGFVYVEVSMNALDFTSSGVLYSYVEPAQLASMHPRCWYAMICAAATLRLIDFPKRTVAIRGILPFTTGI